MSATDRFTPAIGALVKIAHAQGNTIRHPSHGVGYQKSEKTVLYLAYGSNLSAETFQGKRNVRPLSATNVVVPALEMVFDLPGIPYTEPCFSNTRFRPGHSQNEDTKSEAGSLLDAASVNGRRQTNTALGWGKGLVGVVYEVTPEDYANIIATEGGGQAYEDILVECFPLSKDSEYVPAFPKGESFKAHTLFAPIAEGRRMRRDGWAEPSERYLNLITTGAEQNQLPREYKMWLYRLHPYRATTRRQIIGKRIFTTTLRPWILLLFQLQAMFSDENGISPVWFGILVQRLFFLVWLSYDKLYFPVFGEGERTIGDAFGNRYQSSCEVV